MKKTLVALVVIFLICHHSTKAQTRYGMYSSYVAPIPPPKVYKYTTYTTYTTYKPSYTPSSYYKPYTPPASSKSYSSGSSKSYSSGSSSSSGSSKSYSAGSSSSSSGKSYSTYTPPSSYSSYTYSAKYTSENGSSYTTANEANYNDVVYYFDKANYEKAADAAEKVTVTSLGSYEKNRFYTLQLMSYYNTNRYDKIVSVYTYYEPEVADEFYNTYVGEAFLETKKYRKAADYFVKAKLLNKLSKADITLPLYNTGVAFLNVGSFDSSLIYFDAYKKTEKKEALDTGMFYCTGFCYKQRYFNSGKKNIQALDSSTQAFNTYIKHLQSKNISTKGNVYTQRAENKYLKNDYKGCIEDCKKQIAATPLDASPYITKSAAESQLKNLPAAIATCTSGLLIDPNNANLYNNRAYYLCLSKKYLEGLEDAEKAVSLKPNEAIFIDTRGYAKFHLNRFKAALEDFEKAIYLDPTMGVTYYYSGKARLKLNDKTGACADWKQAVYYKIDNPLVTTEDAKALLKMYCK